MTQVITYKSSNGYKIDLTQEQIAQFEKDKNWPKDCKGSEYCTVSHGLHFKHLNEDS